MDDRYVISGSDDTNIRVWKSEKSLSHKLTNTREKAEINYRNKLIEKFKYNSEIKKILKNKNLPKYIVNNQNIRHIQKASKFRKLRNVELNSSYVNSNVYKSEKESNVLSNSYVDKN